MKVCVWTTDERALRSIIRDVTNRDGRWRLKVLRNGRRQISFFGPEASARATLFKLTYIEPKGPVRPHSDEINEIKILIDLMNSQNWDDSCQS